MENVFAKVAFNGTLAVSGTGFQAVGATGSALLNGKQGIHKKVFFKLIIIIFIDINQVLIKSIRIQIH